MKSITLSKLYIWCTYRYILKSNRKYCLQLTNEQTCVLHTQPLVKSFHVKNNCHVIDMKQNEDNRKAEQMSDPAQHNLFSNVLKPPA